MRYRPLTPGQLFIYENGSLVTPYQFSAVLRKSVSHSGFNCDIYKSQSFRIGRAT